jgi:hypothetical protein
MHTSQLEALPVATDADRDLAEVARALGCGYETVSR